MIQIRVLRTQLIKIPLTLFIAFFSTAILRAQIIPSYTVQINRLQSPNYFFCGLLKVDAAFPSFAQRHIIFDQNGEVIYVKQFPNGQLTCDFKLQPNGLMSYYFNDKFYLMDSTFRVIDSVFCKGPVSKDSHELLILPNGHYVLLGNENIEMNLSAYHIFSKNNLPGSKKAIVKCGVIQEQDAKKNVVFEWHSKNYYDFLDVDPYFLIDTLNIDWTHFNAVEYDRDGNILVSARYFNEITKINRRDSTIMWRLGGKKNQFHFINDPQKFMAQHDIRRIANGNITLFDNGRPGSRPATAKEYKLNEKKRTLKLVWSFTDNPKASSIYSGSVSRLPDGNTLINYGSSDNSRTLFNVVKPSGNKIFEIAFRDTLGSYRAFSYKNPPLKLKRPTIIASLKNGQLYLDAGSGYKGYLWSNGQTSQTIPAPVSGKIFVCVSTGYGGYLCSIPYTIGEPAK